MNIETIMIASFAAIALVVIGTFILLERARSDIRKEAEALPLYRIVPWINRKYSLEKKRISRIGASTLCMYMPLNWYDTKEAAQQDMEHLLND